MRIINQTYDISPGIFYRGHYDISANMLRLFMFCSPGCNETVIFLINVLYTPIRKHTICFSRWGIFLRLKSQLISANFKSYIERLVKVGLRIKSFRVPFFGSSKVTYLIDRCSQS